MIARLKFRFRYADYAGMRSVIGLCATVGGTIGGFVPMLWGSSGFSMTAILFTVIGGVAGVWIGVRLVDA